MAPKNNKGGDKKGKGKDAAEGGDSKKGLKPATSINVRHILVCAYFCSVWLWVGCMLRVSISMDCHCLGVLRAVLCFCAAQI